MSNSKEVTLRYKPRYTQMEAYDLLPRRVRDALKVGPQEWDTGHILRAYRQYLKEGYTQAEAAGSMVAMVELWHKIEIQNGKRDWCKHLRKPGQRWTSIPDSPHNRANATMQDAGGLR